MPKLLDIKGFCFEFRRSLSDFREDAAADYTPAQRAHQTEES